MVKATVAARSAPKAETIEYPVMDERLAGQRADCLRAGKAFSTSTVAWLTGKPPADQARWLHATVEVGRAVFQPWALEILFVLGTRGRSRFTELQQLLGISSRTLSDKLSTLRTEGFLEREVFDEQPVRIEYFLTKRGLRTAALASPLICELNRRE